MRTHPVLTQLAEKGVKLGLDAMRGFLAVLGEPHRTCPVVHIAGTNGKGSVTTMVTAALVEAGYRVGTCTSPHLEDVNERVRIDGVPVDDATLIEDIEALDRARWDWAQATGQREAPLTYFEFLTALAFWRFAREAVDVAVVEVGLGGRLDATNVVRPLVCAVTSIGLDHQEQLGDTIEAIAAEKAGIFKKGASAVLGPTAPEARKVLEARATALGMPCWRPGNELRREQRGGRWSFNTPEGRVEGVTLAMRGVHQGANASVAVGILHQLRRSGFLIPDEAIARGLSRAVIAGRIETLRPGLVVDGAHNPDGTRALAAWLAEQPRPASRILLFGMGQDRDPVRVIEPLLPHVDEVVTTRCAHPKARDSLELAKHLQDLDVVLSDGGPIEEALPEIFAEANETIVAGSLFLAGAARSLVAAGALDGIEPGQGPAEAEE